MARYGFIFLLITLAALSRLLPHPPNMAPITALALFGGVYLDKRLSFIIPMLAMFISDYFIGFYPGMPLVYLSFIAIGVIGLWLRNHRNVRNTIGATLAGSTLFFIVTNFGAWLFVEAAYSRDFAGLLQCYVAAIPFFRNTLIGDVLYVGILFGLFELAKKYIPALRPEPSPVKL